MAAGGFGRVRGHWYDVSPNCLELVMKKAAIVRSNYIPWKGYFDVIAAVDEFILYDDVQFTTRDWRNGNQLKTPQGAEWLSVAVGKNARRPIRKVELHDQRWQARHWRALELNYQRAPFFEEIAAWLKPIYIEQTHRRLSSLNRELIEAICAYLGLATRISSSWDYHYEGERSERLVELCARVGASENVSGPSARAYLDEAPFRRAGIILSWFDDSNYPSYPQPWGEFVHQVTVLDLLFNCGAEAPHYMKYAR